MKSQAHGTWPFLLLLTLQNLPLSVSLATPPLNTTGSRYLWYTSPAPSNNWEEGVLPIGNGRLGATIFGSVNEIITINEDTIWNGPLQDRTPGHALAALPVAREMLLNGSISAAGDFVQRKMMDENDEMRGFSYFGNLEVGFGFGGDIDVELEGYRRWLDTGSGVAGVEFGVWGVKYTREYIASFPAGVLAARYTASKKGALSINATFSRSEDISSLEASADGDTPCIKLTGTSGQPAEENPIMFSGQASFVAEGAKFTASNGTLFISNATTIDIFFEAETNYRYADEDAIDVELKRKLDNALSQGFNSIKSEAVKDVTALLGRASLNLGNSSSEIRALPTDERLVLARSGLDEDPELATLAWNYGRHMLVASSRNTEADIDLPANLQGVWNSETTAAWGGKYTININTEMNYWAAGPTNLIETQEPLFDLYGVAYPRGTKLASDMYNCSGVVFHHNLELWGDPAPTDNYTSASMWPMGAAWLVTHLVDHYRFTGDKGLLSETIYPHLVDVAKFYECYTFEYEGHRVTGPSVSPENTFIIPQDFTIANDSAAMDIGISMDDQIIWEVLNDLLYAASELGIDDSDEDVSSAQHLLSSLHPPQISPSTGRIQEWRLDYEEAAPGHRHLSPLFALHPGKQFSPLLNTSLSTAASKLLDKRLADGSGSTGWSNAWFINQYARLGRGEDAWKQLEKWFSIYPMSNLWNTDDGATFQIDGNFGVTSGITEMLLQSHAGVVHILPALPGDSAPEGFARGLKARGGFEVDVEWEGGRLKRAVVKSERGEELRVRVGDGDETVYVDGVVYEGGIGSKVGGKYVIAVENS
ncbi:Six-hairpin glycosidase-like protein [Aspergillus filifer]